MATVDGSGPMRVSVTEQMGRTGRRDPVGDIPRHPRPEHKPSRDAHWDEAAGRWEVWSEEHQGWVCLEEGTVQAPGTPSVEAADDAVPPTVPPPGPPR